MDVRRHILQDEKEYLLHKEIDVSIFKELMTLDLDASYTSSKILTSNNTRSCIKYYIKYKNSNISLVIFF